MSRHQTHRAAKPFSTPAPGDTFGIRGSDDLGMLSDGVRNAEVPPSATNATQRRVLAAVAQAARRGAASNRAASAGAAGTPLAVVGMLLLSPAAVKLEGIGKRTRGVCRLPSLVALGRVALAAWAVLIVCAVWLHVSAPPAVDAPAWRPSFPGTVKLEGALPRLLAWRYGASTALLGDDPEEVPPELRDPGDPARQDAGATRPYDEWHIAMADEKLPREVRMRGGTAPELLEEMGVRPPEGRPLRCAVVGNARSLLGRGLGERIDAHDVVVRHNQAPTAGFEDDVGRRSHLRVLHDPRAFYGEDGVQRLPDERAPTEVILVRLYPNSKQAAFIRKLEVVDHAVGEGHRFHISSFELEHAAFRLLWHGVPDADIPPRYRIVSTGLIGTVAALSICDKVTLYGFNPADYREVSGVWRRLSKPLRSTLPVFKGGRYFDEVEQRYSSPHDFSREQEVLAAMMQRLPGRLVVDPVYANNGDGDPF